MRGRRKSSRGDLFLLAKYVDGERKNAWECPFLEINIFEEKVGTELIQYGEKKADCFLGYSSEV